MRHDDVIVVPEFFCEEEDWDTYYALIKDTLLGVLQLPFLGPGVMIPGLVLPPRCQEMRESQARGERKACCQISGVVCLPQDITGP